MQGKSTQLPTTSKQQKVQSAVCRDAGGDSLLSDPPRDSNVGKSVGLIGYKGNSSEVWWGVQCCIKCDGLEGVVWWCSGFCGVKGVGCSGIYI